MGKPDGSIPPPSSSILPSGCPRPGRPPQGPGEASGPARPGSPQGKGCLCLKVTTRARCPGWAWCLPFPGRGGGDGGPPQISGGDRGKAPLPPPPTPRNGPLRDQPASGGGGVNSFHCWGVGDQVNSFHCLGAVGRGRPSGLLPHPSLPSLPEAPFLPGTPRRDERRGRRGRARGGDEGSPAPTGKPPSAAPLPSSFPKGEEQGEGRRPPGRGRGGLPAPPPVER